MTMDHAVALLSQYGQDALMAKIDLKAAFRLIPVQAADWVHLHGDLLARTVLCGHMPSFWSSFSPCPL